MLYMFQPSGWWCRILQPSTTTVGRYPRRCELGIRKWWYTPSSANNIAIVHGTYVEIKYYMAWNIIEYIQTYLKISEIYGGIGKHDD